MNSQNYIEKLGFNKETSDFLTKRVALAKKDMSGYVKRGEDYPFSCIFLNTHEGESQELILTSIDQESKVAAAKYFSQYSEMMKANLLITIRMGWMLPEGFTKNWTDENHKEFKEKYRFIENHPERQEFGLIGIQTKNMQLDHLARVTRNKKNKGTVGEWKASFSQFTVPKKQSLFGNLIKYD